MYESIGVDRQQTDRHPQNWTCCNQKLFYQGSSNVVLSRDSSSSLDMQEPQAICYHCTTSHYLWHLHCFHQPNLPVSDFFWRTAWLYLYTPQYKSNPSLHNQSVTHSHFLVIVCDFFFDSNSENCNDDGRSEGRVSAFPLPTLSLTLVVELLDLIDWAKESLPSCTTISL